MEGECHAYILVSIFILHCCFFNKLGRVSFEFTHDHKFTRGSRTGVNFESMHRHQPDWAVVLVYSTKRGVYHLVTKHKYNKGRTKCTTSNVSHCLDSYSPCNCWPTMIWLLSNHFVRALLTIYNAGIVHNIDSLRTIIVSLNLIT